MIRAEVIARIKELEDERAAIRAARKARRINRYTGEEEARIAAINEEELSLVKVSGDSMLRLDTLVLLIEEFVKYARFKDGVSHDA